jgi:hypothetical protein
MPEQAVAAFRTLAAQLPASPLQRASRRIAASYKLSSSDEQESFKDEESDCDQNHQNANLEAPPSQS